ncbi:dopamine N-acetyltransferase-like isoform X2 [Ctenocephalides felis]|uniref:dopamine N-acetyltransferase-like isoform X2 n=1 Tax=Ctenocephalides felis TaxID=7515 RepID=UPI000E6E1BFB|nr:dopamine N-acetyltransferase-like isoform X2 [Ctenocephalides felis]
MDNMRQLPKISFHDISPFEYKEIMSFLMQHYYPEEILTVSIQPKEPTTPDIEFTMEAIQEGYSVKAIITCEDEDCDGGEEIINDKVDTCTIVDETKKVIQYKNGILSADPSTNINLVNESNSRSKKEIIVGVAINGSIEPDDAKIMLEEADKCEDGKWSTILRFLAELERDADVCKRFRAERGLHTHVMAVHPDYRGLGIGTLLLEASALRAKNSRFGVYSVDCTSAYSTRAAQRCSGLTALRSVRYEDYKNSKGEQVFKPQDPVLHHSVTTFVQNFGIPEIA